MADLDYTNIAGSPFQPYVATQIEKRKALVNNDYRNSSELNWLSNKNVWIRVSSGANVRDDNPNYQGLHGDELSKKYILQGGLLNHLPNKDTYLLRSGIGPDNAYGIGGTDFGLTPMPGITNISIKTGGKLGTLKETTIDFVCHNMEQLNIMEALYMKLGFGLLVEWGHTYYIDNKTEKIENVPQPLPFYGIHTKEELMSAITTHRINHSGNYDASWGTIKNFTYSLSKNGTFNCQVQLVGAGDILESLKVNISGEYSGSVSDNELSGSIYPVISDANKSLLNGALYSIYSKDVLGIPEETGLEKLVNKAANFLFGDNVVRDNYTIETNVNYLSYIQPFYSNINLDLLDWSNNTELQRKGYNYRLINKPGVADNYDGDIDDKVSAITVSNFFARLIIDYETTGEEETNTSDITKPGLAQVYITLGNLLLLIKSTGMLYQRNEGEGQDKQRPYIYIDVNPDTNRCFTFQGHCSLDPSVCLIGSNNLPFGITSQVFDDIKANFPWFNDDSNLGGRFMWTLVNVDWVTSILKKWRTNDKKGNVYFVDLVKDILDGISKATGGYNEFRIVPDDDSRCIRILDDRRTNALGQPIADDYYTEIPVLGKRSIVYDFNYTSKIAPNTAAMIVVAAQAQPYGVQGAENALAFSHLNKGLYNRLDTVVVDSGTESNKNANTNSNVEQRYIELRTYIENIYSGQGTGALSESENQETFEVEQNVFGEDLPPVISKVNKDNFKIKLRAALEAVIRELKLVAQNSTNDASKEIAALDKAKSIIVSSAIANDFENYKTLYQFAQKDLAEIDIPKSSMYAYVTFLLNNNNNYQSPNSIDSDIENLWQEKLEELNENKQKSDF